MRNELNKEVLTSIEENKQKNRLSLEEREENALRSLEARQQARSVGLNKFAQSNYLENPQLKEFNKKLRIEGFKKARRPIKLGSIEETAQDISAYFDMCDTYSQLPSIKSLCLYLGISVSTYNTYLRETDSEYGELFRAAIDYIHSIIEGGALNNKINPATYMFTASNFYGMKDSKQIDISAIAPSQNNSISSRESLNALRNQVEKEKGLENVKEATYTEKEVEVDE